ncbi:neutral zinc metallopeptidase [Nocardioides sp. GCM10027113]|uniref:KPN_02809 family neutral zinc metallopeptidase n=1 Tax=unclassified Nocardioides TaxID=2615069 RepID=UPI00361BAC6F
MRFNPKARLDTRRVSHRSRGGGGGGGLGGGGTRLPVPGGAAAGGGIGLVVVVIAFLLLTQLGGGDTGGGGGSADDGRYEQCLTGADANESADCARVAVENSLHDYWSETLPEQAGVEFRPQRDLVTFDGSVDTGCGPATSATGPFYCPADRTIYLDTTFFDEVLDRQLGGGDGDFVEPYVLAHEMGHHLQNLTGALGRVRTQQGPESDAVRLELQADCYAGMWAGAASSTDDAGGEPLFTELTREDIEEAVGAAKAVGDDRIQQRSGGRVDPDGWTHGSSEQRVRWFLVGYENGSFEDCDTFAASSL